MYQQVKVASGLNILLSIWLIVSPFLLGFSAGSALALWDAIVVGVVVLILSWIRMANPESATWISWVSALLGLWLIVSPFVLGTSFIMAVMWDDIIVGIGMVIFGAWAALAAPAAAS